LETVNCQSLHALLMLDVSTRLSIIIFALRLFRTVSVLWLSRLAVTSHPITVAMTSRFSSCFSLPQSPEEAADQGGEADPAGASGAGLLHLPERCQRRDRRPQATAGAQEVSLLPSSTGGPEIHAHRRYDRAAPCTAAVTPSGVKI